MFLTTVKSKGNYYIYLCSYCVQENYSTKKQNIYSFGRKEQAISKMYKWKSDFRSFPIELFELGCSMQDLNEWIRTIETGVTKTGKRFKAAI